MSIPEGIYKAKILSHGIGETKAGLPQATVTFEIEVDGTKKNVTWFGSFKEGRAQEITIASLLACGLKGNNPAGPLDVGRVVSITMEDETGTDNKVRSKVRWVNSLHEVKTMPQDQAKAKLSALEGAVMQARMNNNIPESNDANDIPDWMK